MEVRGAPLPHDLQYFLDGAIEAWEINALTHDVLNLFGESATIARIIEGDRRRTARWIDSRKAKCIELSQYAGAIAAELGVAWQRAFFASSIAYEIHLVGEIARICADWNFEDETTGGAMKPWRKFSRCDASYDPTKGLKRRLHAPEYIRRSVKRYVATEFRHAHQLVDMVRPLPWPRSLDEGARITVARTESIARYRTIVQQKMCGPRKALAKPERRALTRAAAMATSIVGEEKVRRFVAGHSVAIEGETMILEARPQGSLARCTGHGQLEVSIKRKDGEALGKLCVYFEKTAALDQLAALALHVGAGNEQEILSKGNLYGVTLAGATDPLLSRFYRQPVLEGLEPNFVLDAGESRHDKLRRAQLRYFADVGHHYIDAMFVQMWGRDAKRLRGYARAA